MSSTDPTAPPPVVTQGTSPTAGDPAPSNSGSPPPNAASPPAFSSLGLTLAMATVNAAGTLEVKNFRSSVADLKGPLYVYILPIPPGQEHAFNGVTPARWGVVELVADLLNKYPDLHPTLTSADILAGKAAADAMSLGATDMTNVAHDMSDTATVTRSLTWGACSVVIDTATTRAKNSKSMANDVGAIKSKLKIGARVDTAAKTAAAEQNKVTKAQAKLAKAQEKSDAANASSARATASSLAHGTGDATIVTPAPGTPTTGSGGTPNR